MKRNFRQALALITIGLIGCSPVLHAQVVYKIINSKENSMKVSGTSSLHNWAMDTKNFAGEAQFGFTAGNNNQLNTLTSLTFSLMVSDLKSDKTGLDKNAYKALKNDKYKNITYKLISSTVSPGKENKYLVKTHGYLTISGITKEVIMNVYCLVNNNAIITCTGSYELKMSDYQVKPPSFMFGAMKTGDAINLTFSLVYKK